MGGEHDERHPEGEHELFERQDDQEAPAVDLVRQQPPDHRQDQCRPELGEDDDADEGGRVREVVGVGTEDDVLHPGADVRGEGSEEDDAEGPVRQRGPGRSPRGGSGVSPSTTASSISSIEMCRRPAVPLG